MGGNNLDCRKNRRHDKEEEEGRSVTFGGAREDETLWLEEVRM